MNNTTDEDIERLSIDELEKKISELEDKENTLRLRESRALLDH